MDMDLATIFFWMGVGATSLFVIKMVLMLAGGDADSDFDVDVDVDADADAFHPDSTGGFTVLSLQSFLAFFMGMGWAGWGCAREMGNAATVGVASAVGFAFMVVFAFLFSQLKRLDDPKILHVRSSVGTHGRAYMNIPEKGKGRGKVTLTVEGRRMVIAASSASDAIEAFADVTVVSVDDDDSLVVELRT